MGEQRGTGLGSRLNLLGGMAVILTALRVLEPVMNLD